MDAARHPWLAPLVGGDLLLSFFWCVLPCQVDPLTVYRLDGAPPLAPSAPFTVPRPVFFHWPNDHSSTQHILCKPVHRATCLPVIATTLFGRRYQNQRGSSRFSAGPRRQKSGIMNCWSPSSCPPASALPRGGPPRSTLKYCCRGLLSAVLARSPGWPKTEARRRHAVDIPSKVAVYGCMGFR